MNEHEKEALKRAANNYGVVYCVDLDVTATKKGNEVIFENGKPENFNELTSEIYQCYFNVWLLCKIPSDRINDIIKKYIEKTDIKNQIGKKKFICRKCKSEIILTKDYLKKPSFKCVCINCEPLPVVKSIFDRIHYQIGQRRWREDLGLYEDVYIFMGVKYYHYHVLKGDIKITQKTLFQKPNPVYMDKPTITYPKIGRKVFEEEYKGNKWAIPINYEIDLNLP
jgi:hypothetical protein